MYVVPSQSGKKSVLYSVDAEYGLCACPNGQNGAFCKHQAFIHERFNVTFPNAPAIRLEDRYKLAVLALGNKCPGIDFFRDLQDVTTVQFPDMPEVCHAAVNEMQNVQNQPGEVPDTSDSLDMATLLQTAHLEMTRLATLVTPYTAKALTALLPYLQSIRSQDDMITAAYQCRTAMCAKKGGIIRVQPMSIARRRLGVTRGSKRVAAGRPASGSKPPLKRPRLLAANIEQNVPHAKSHGVGH